MDHEDYVAENRAHWDELAEHHPDTDAYDVEAFLDGETTLRRLEREELGDLAAGSRLLHLQCHFGLDTLTWVRDGGVAHATGVDFSETAVETARDLRDQVGIDHDRARFVEADVLELPAVLEDTYEVVFTSYGTVYWLPDLDRWAEGIAHALEPGGVFYMADGHPFVEPFHWESTADDPQVAHSYFNEDPLTFEHDGSYAGEGFGMENRRAHGYSHPVGEILTALVDAGLRIDFWHDHPWSFFQRFDAMEEREDGRWYLPGLEGDLPFTFSLKAHLPE
ncbi:SAM-dependent methyltransferase [Halobacteriales archaeon QS_8_69_26]|nr:MAG: SAM-dependent methyltransferase [Halobacteriales archaeon QS_8_69_26]